MKRLHAPILVVVLLLTQWGVLNHDYHIYDSADNCDFCLSAHALNYAHTPVLQFVFEPTFFRYQPNQTWNSVSKNGIRLYAARAPPRFI